MEIPRSAGKQLLIQLAINVVASAIVSYIMYKLLQPKDETTTTASANLVSNSPTVTATTAPTTTTGV